MTVKDLAVFHLLLHLEIAHLALLLPLHLVSLRGYPRQVQLLMSFDVLRHLVLIHLIVQDALVRILKFMLVHLLLLDLLCGSHTLRLISLQVLQLELFFLRLLLQSEVVHVLLVDMSLLVECCALLSYVSLMVGIKGVVLELIMHWQVASRLARLNALVRSIF